MSGTCCALTNARQAVPRQARVVVPGAPHHVTQRGNRRQQTFFRDADYLTYLHLAAEAFSEAGVEVWAYCLMPNHVHLIAAPTEPSALAAAVGRDAPALHPSDQSSRALDRISLAGALRLVPDG